MQVDLIPHGADVYPSIAQQLEVTDYADFPFHMLAYANALKSSQLLIVSGPGAHAYFRLYGRSLLLITYNGYAPGLTAIIDELTRLHYHVVRSLDYVHKVANLPIVQHHAREYEAYRHIFMDMVGSNFSTTEHRKHLRHAWKQGNQHYYLGAVTEQQALDLHKQWIEDVKKRYITSDHWHANSLLGVRSKKKRVVLSLNMYNTYIHNYFAGVGAGNAHIVGVYTTETDALWGMFGYEVHAGQAQMPLLKHRLGDNIFAQYIWLKALNHIFEQHGVFTIYCGTTTDKLKKYIGLQPCPAFRIQF